MVKNMVILRKILFIAVIGVVAGNVDVRGMNQPPQQQNQPVLDFNNIVALGVQIPFCFQPHNYNAPQNGQLPIVGLHNGENYVYFNVIPAQEQQGAPQPPPLQVVANAAVNRAPALGETNIYFPRDGRQPTTPNAVAWSCANIDNRENSPITEWYMKMFGVIPFQNNNYIQAGWTDPAHLVEERIISYNFMDGLVTDLQELHNAYVGLGGGLAALPTLNGTNITTITQQQVKAQHKENLIQFINLLENLVAAAENAHPAFQNNQFKIRTLRKLRILLNQMAPDETVNVFVAKLTIAFRKNFKKIASTSVGRTLLYRILIEIRRHNGANIGISETPIVPMPEGILDDLADARNSLRSLTIDFDSSRFSQDSSMICIEDSPLHSKYVISNISGIGPNGRYDGIVRHEHTADVTLFHEMNHWYYALRNIQRVHEEKNNAEGGQIRHFDSTVTQAGQQVQAMPPRAAAIGNYYWGGFVAFNNANMINSELKWSDNGRPNYNEIRNILGVPINAGDNPIANTINGDDLSENLYRMCIGMPLRFGHINHGFSFYEDSVVIDRVIRSCTLQKAHYNCMHRAIGILDRPYGDGTRKGLGSGEI